MSSEINIAAVIPTWRRQEALTRALERILGCRPAPREVLVHVDAGDEDTEQTVAPLFGDKVRWYRSASPQGPGGGRNLLFREARSPLIASFDDDSWPMLEDYFAVAAEIMTMHPQVAVLGGEVVSPGCEPRGRDGRVRPVASFQCGACIIRRESFVGTHGFLPLRYAYGMEETDLALQLLDAGWEIIYSPSLRVYHDSRPVHHASSAVNASHICNTALLAYLRYPISYWPLGLLQVANRVHYAIKARRYRGILRGLCQIPSTAWKFRYERRPVRPGTVSMSRRLARDSSRG